VLTWARARDPRPDADRSRRIPRLPRPIRESRGERNDNVVHYTRMPQMVTSLACGQPDLLADDIRALPRSFRTNAPSQDVSASAL